MNSRFRVGIVGSGAVARVCHVPAVLASPLATLTALVDPVAERARAIARDYGVAPLIASSLEDVLDKVDGIVIATPNNTHAPLAQAAIGAGIPCLIEKPLCITADEGREICEVARARGVVVAVGYCQRFDDGVVLVKKLLDESSLGSVRRFHCQSGSIGGWSPESGYILDRKSAGGGVLTMNGSHYIDRLLYWFGYPDDVSLRHDGVAGPEAHCFAKLHYNSRSLQIDGSMLFSKLVRLDSGVVLRTERGVLATGGNGSPVLWRSADTSIVTAEFRPSGPPRWRPEATLFQRQLDDFIQACRGEHPPAVPAEIGVQSVRLLQDLYRSQNMTSTASVAEELA